MTFTLVSNGTAVSGTASPRTVTVNSGSGTAAGNLCVVKLAMPGYTAAPTFTFPANWVQGPVQAYAAGASAQIWYLTGANNPGGITTISVSFTGGTTSSGATIISWGEEYSGGDASSPPDLSVSGHGTSSPANETAAPTAAAGELAVTVTAVYNSAATTQTLAAGSGFTQVAQLNNGSSSKVHGAGDYQPDTGASGSTVTDSVSLTATASAYAWCLATFTPAVSFMPPPAQQYGRDAAPSPPQQRQYYDPSLLATAELENELLGGAGTPMRYDAPAWTRLPSWPQQRAYVSDPLLLTTAELENELLGGGETGKYYRIPAAHAPRWWMPQQPARLADPLLIQTAELENELLGGADTARHYLTSVYIDRREVPQQRAYVSDPLLLATAELENELLGGGDTARHYLAAAYWDRRLVPQQRLYESDPLLLTTAELENELLGGGDTGRHYAWFTDRREVPQQRLYVSDPLLLTTAELENELLGGADTGRHWLPAAYWDRRFVPQQRAYVSDPLLLSQLLPLDPTLSAWASLQVAYLTPVLLADRREYPAQRARISDPSFYPHISMVRFAVLAGRQQWTAGSARQSWSAPSARNSSS